MEDKGEIEIELDTLNDANDDEIKVEIASEAEKPKLTSVSTEEGIESLRAQLDQERSARVAAERKAQEYSQSAYTAQSEVHDSNLHLVTNAISTVSRENEILKSNYRDAMSVGDFDAAADIQGQMSSNAAKLLQLEQGRQALESQPKPQAPQPYHADPVEAIASQLSATAPRSASWVRNHPEFARDERMFNKMMAAHQIAVADGLVPESDEYFSEIETILRVNKTDSLQNYTDPSVQAAQVTQRRSAPPAAPVTRTGSPPGTRPGTVRLTPQQIEMAEMMGMTPQQYAKNMMALKKEGKIN
jgi:hypothetical protein